MKKPHLTMLLAALLPLAALTRAEAGNLSVDNYHTGALHLSCPHFSVSMDASPDGVHPKHINYNYSILYWIFAGNTGRCDISDETHKIASATLNLSNGHLNITKYDMTYKEKDVIGTDNPHSNAVSVCDEASTAFCE